MTKTASCLTEAGSKRSRTLAPDTLVIANSGATLGVAKILGIECCANDGIAALVDHRLGSKEFLVYYLNTQTRYLRDVVAPGNGQPNLNTGLIREIKVPFPEVGEQRAIASLLGDVDRSVVALDALISKKRAIKQGVMQLLLTGKVRLPGFSGDWCERPYADVATIRKGMVLPHTQSKGFVPVIAAGQAPAGYTVHGNRVGPVVTISASGASAGFVAMHRGPIWASDCSTIEAARGYDLDFIYYSLVLRQDEIYRTQTGGAQPHVHAKDVHPLILQSPVEVAEQAAVAGVLRHMDDEIGALERRLESARAVKQGMLQELLTGRTRLLPAEAAS